MPSLNYRFFLVNKKHSNSESMIKFKRNQVTIKGTNHKVFAEVIMVIVAVKVGKNFVMAYKRWEVRRKRVTRKRHHFFG